MKSVKKIKPENYTKRKEKREKPKKKLKDIDKNTRRFNLGKLTICSCVRKAIFRCFFFETERGR